MRIRLSWSEFDQLCVKLADTVRPHGPFDLIVGVARGGLPLAVRLSHLLEISGFGIILARRSNSENPFDIGEGMETSQVLADCRAPRRVLIVDDIIATGKLATTVEGQVRDRFGEGLTFTHASLYADTAGVGAGAYSRLLDTLHFAQDVDNKAIWLDFPWEVAS